MRQENGFPFRNNTGTATILMAVCRAFSGAGSRRGWGRSRGPGRCSRLTWWACNFRDAWFYAGTIFVTACQPWPIADFFDIVEVQPLRTVELACQKSRLALVELIAIRMRKKDGLLAGNGTEAADILGTVEFRASSAAGWWWWSRCSCWPHCGGRTIWTCDSWLASFNARYPIVTACKPRPITDHFLLVEMESFRAIEPTCHESSLTLVELVAIFMRKQDGILTGNGAKAAHILVTLEIRTT